MNKQVQQLLGEMQAKYVAGLPQKLETMTKLVTNLLRDEDYEHSLEDLYLAVHSLKGTAGTYGLSIISSICQPFEDYLASVREEGTADRNRQAIGCLPFLELLNRASRLLVAGRKSFPEIEASLARL